MQTRNKLLRSLRALCSVLVWIRPIAAAPTLNSQDVIRGIEQAQEYREDCLAGYTVTEEYSIKNSHFDEPAIMTVHVTYQRDTGKKYEVISRKGPNFLQKRVLDRLLAEETAMSRGQDRQRSLLTTANYSMEVVGTEQINGISCYVLKLTPKAKSLHLLKGRAWVDAKTFSLVKLEGKQSASPSFWTGRPLIVRDYVPVQGFWLAQRSHATSDGFLIGKTELNISYSNYSLLHDTGASNTSRHCSAPNSPWMAGPSAAVVTQ